MFRDPEKPGSASTISQQTVVSVVLDALQDYMGGDALGCELEKINPKTVQALKDLKDLRDVLLDRKGWWDLGYALDMRIRVLENELETWERAWLNANRG